MLVFLHETIDQVNDSFAQYHIALPPGALNLKNFIDRCDGCLTCLANCPFESIFIMKDSTGKQVPFLDPENHPCHLCEDMPCATSCPSGAVLRMPEHWVDMGTAELDFDLCLNATGSICKMCYYACPINDKAMLWDDNQNRPVINETLCTGCGNCRALCPTRAISITAKSTS